MKIQKLSLKNEKRFLNNLRTVFSLKNISEYFYDNSIGILILLSHIKCKDWPRKDQELNNEPIEGIPFLWALCYAENKTDIIILYDLHPAKCFPVKFNKENGNPNKKPLPLERDQYGTLASCARYQVHVNCNSYNIFEKIPLYCSVFGMPDDCYSSNFENIMLANLSKFKNLNLWCFEETKYISKKILPQIDLKFFKGNLLPSKLFPFVNTASKFLRGIFKKREINSLNSEPWYSECYELIHDLNPFESPDYFQYEEVATFFIEKKLIYEFIRLALLIKNKKILGKFNQENKPKLELEYLSNYLCDLNNIINNIEETVKDYLKNFIDNNKQKINFDMFKKSRFLILDVEFAHISYPDGNVDRTFNFPCITTNIIWQGIRKGFDVKIYIHTLACHFCPRSCEFFRKKVIKYDCICLFTEFFDNLSELFSNLLAIYDNFKFYSYGKSDFFQLEQLSNFFTDSFEKEEFKRKNRIKTRHLVEIAEDLALNNKSLNYIEENIIKIIFPDWERAKIKEKVNKRYMTKYGSKKWEENYRNIILNCMDDTISTLLYLLCIKYT